MTTLALVIAIAVIGGFVAVVVRDRLHCRIPFRAFRPAPAQAVLFSFPCSGAAKRSGDAA